MKQIIRNFALFFCLSLFLGCSSLSSHKEAKNSKGLTYFLPKKDFKITLNFNNSQIKTISFDVTEAYADREYPYVLSHEINLFGDNKTDLGINNNGLLVSANSSVDSKVNESLTNLAKAVGMTLAFEGAPQEEDKKQQVLKFECAENTGEKSYVVILPANSAFLNKFHDMCGVNIKVTPRILNDKVEGVDDNVIAGSGVFYRQDISYEISAKKGTLLNHHASTPSLSKTHFLPISKSFFANSKSEFTFTNGIPNTYKQETYSEFTNLFKLPGDIIGGVFTGIGSVFDSFKTTSTSESDYLKAMRLRDKDKYFSGECTAAIVAKDSTLIEKYCI